MLRTAHRPAVIASPLPPTTPPAMDHALRHRFRIACAALFAGAALAACTPATVRLPPELAGDGIAYEVEGHSPRRWQQALRFGPYRTVGMREGADFSWGLPIFGSQFGRASKPWRFTLVALGEAPVEVDCRTQATHLYKRGFSVDISEALAPRMVCGVRQDGGEPLVFELADKGHRYDGAIFPARGGRVVFGVRSLHGYAGSPLDSAEPLGYEIQRGDRTVAAIDTLNAGRVTFSPDTAPRERVLLAAMASALLMFEPEQSPLFAD